jgi:hypothetical protein
LKHGGRFNLGALLDSSPYTYWFRVAEISNILQDIGFEIVAIGTASQIKAGSLKKSYTDLEKEDLSGGLYIVVTK